MLGWVEVAIETERHSVTRHFDVVAELVARTYTAEVGVTHLEAEDALVAITGVIGHPLFWCAG